MKSPNFFEDPRPRLVFRRWKLASPVLIGAIIGVSIAVTALWHEPPVVGAQDPPSKIFNGTVSSDSQLIPDGTAIKAYVDGNVVGKGIVKAGVYKLLVQQPRGQVFDGKDVRFVIGDQKAAQTYTWRRDGRAHELNLSAGGGITGQSESLQQVMECMLSALGRVPSGSQDLTGQERSRLLKECPDVIRNLGALNKLSQSVATPQTNQPSDNLQKLHKEIDRQKKEKPLAIQRELDRHNREIVKTRTDLSKAFQLRVDRLNRDLSDANQRKNKELEVSTGPHDRQRIEDNYRDLLDNLRRKKSDYQSSGRRQIEEEISRLERNRDQAKRSLEEENRREIERLEQSIRDLEDSIERNRYSSDQRKREEQDRERREEEDRARHGRERLMEAERFEREKKLEEERFQHQVELDEERFKQERQLFEQEKRRNEERFQLGVQLQGDGPAPNSGSRKSPQSPRNNPAARGFFTNSVSGSISDVDKFMDPTTLAVLGILLTLLATSLSLVKGN